MVTILLTSEKWYKAAPGQTGRALPGYDWEFPVVVMPGDIRPKP
jgi:hypothetical protein